MFRVPPEKFLYTLKDKYGIYHLVRAYSFEEACRSKSLNPHYTTKIYVERV